MEDAILSSASPHESIKSRRGASQHEANVCRGEHDAFGFAGCARGIDDRDRIFVAHLRTIDRNSLDSCKDLVKEKLRGGFIPDLLDAATQRSIAAADHCRSAVLHHRDQFGWSLTRIER